MSGLLRRIRRPGAAEETRTEPIALPEPAHGSDAPTAPDGERSPAPAVRADGRPLPAGVAPEDLERRAGAGRRGKLRRRARFLRRARELALRDLGGLVYEAHRRQQDGGALVKEKAQQLARARRGAARPRDRARRPARGHRPARARRRRHLPALRRAARERRPLLLELRARPDARRAAERGAGRPSGAGRSDGAKPQRPADATAAERRPSRRRERRRAGRRAPSEQPTTEAAPAATPQAGNGRAKTSADTAAHAEPAPPRPPSVRMTEVATPPPATERACPRCGASLAPDQEWCLSCGTAVRTRIAPTPRWRVPVVLVGTLLALIAAALILALVELSGDPQPVAKAPSTTPTATPAGAPADDGGSAAPVVGETPTPAPTAVPSVTPTPEHRRPTQRRAPTQHARRRLDHRRARRVARRQDRVDRRAGLDQVALRGREEGARRGRRRGRRPPLGRLLVAAQGLLGRLLRPVRLAQRRGDRGRGRRAAAPTRAASSRAEPEPGSG